MHVPQRMEFLTHFSYDAIGFPIQFNTEKEGRTQEGIMLMIHMFYIHSDDRARYSVDYPQYNSYYYIFAIR